MLLVTIESNSDDVNSVNILTVLICMWWFLSYLNVISIAKFYMYLSLMNVSLIVAANLKKKIK